MKRSSARRNRLRGLSAGLTKPRRVHGASNGWLGLATNSAAAAAAAGKPFPLPHHWIHCRTDGPGLLITTQGVTIHVGSATDGFLYKLRYLGSMLEPLEIILSGPVNTLEEL